MKRTIIFLLILFSFSGCFLKSVNPLITTENAITLDELESSWQSDDQRWTFINDPVSLPNIAVKGSNFLGSVGMKAGEGETIFNDENIYLVIFENLQNMSADTTLFIGYVGDLGGDQFLDLSLLDLNSGDDTFKSAHLFPVHSFSRISLKNDELSIEFFKDRWIKEQILDNRVRIKHERVTEGPMTDEFSILITAGTHELRQFVSKYKSDERAFEEPLELLKVRDAI